MNVIRIYGYFVRRKVYLIYQMPKHCRKQIESGLFQQNVHWFQLNWNGKTKFIFTTSRSFGMCNQIQIAIWKTFQLGISSTTMLKLFT